MSPEEQQAMFDSLKPQERTREQQIQELNDALAKAAALQSEIEASEPTKAAK